MTTKLHVKQMITKEYMLDELRSFAITFLSILSIDGFMLLNQVYSGTWDESLWIALGFAAIRSAVKAVFTMLFPVLFPLRTSK